MNYKYHATEVPLSNGIDTVISINNKNKKFINQYNKKNLITLMISALVSIPLSVKAMSVNNGEFYIGVSALNNQTGIHQPLSFLPIQSSTPPAPSVGVGLLIDTDNNQIIHTEKIEGTLYDNGQRDSAIIISGNNNRFIFTRTSVTNGNVDIQGTGNSIGGDGHITGQLNLGNNNIYEMMAGDNLHATGNIELGDSTTLNISGIKRMPAPEYLFLTSGERLNGEFKEALVGGQLLSESDFFSYSYEKVGNSYYLDYTLSWYDTSAKAHGNFTLKNQQSLFRIDIDLDSVPIVILNTNWDGRSLTKLGLGTLILNGENSYNGLTDVQGGRLIVGETSANKTATIAGDVNVQSQATLGGHGQILGSVTLQSRAKLAPGNSIGTITVNSITFNPGSIYEFEVNPDGTSDKVTVTNTATINGGEVQVLANNGNWSANSSFTLLSATGGVTGTFDTVTSNLAFLTPSLRYDANNIYLDLARNNVTFASVSNSFNQEQVSKVIDKLPPSNPLVGAITGMEKTTALNAYDNLSGEIYASTYNALLHNSLYVRETVNQRFNNNSEGVWLNIWGHRAKHKSDGNAAMTENQSEGFMAGNDNRSGQSKFGFGAGYEHGKIESRNSRNSQSEIDSFHIALYSNHYIGGFDIRGGIGYSYIKVDTDREIWVANLKSENSASYDGNLWQVFVEGSHNYEISKSILVMPYANVAYTYLETEGLDEGDSNTALNVKRRADNVTNTTVGLRTGFNLNKESGLYADIGWQHVFFDKEDSNYHQFKDSGEAFRVKGSSIAKDSGIVGAGLNYAITSHISTDIGYKGLFGGKTIDNSAHVSLNYNF